MLGMMINVSLIGHIANVTDFLQCADKSIVLDQSFRVPKSVHDVASEIINKIVFRKLKDGEPKRKRFSFILF